MTDTGIGIDPRLPAARVRSIPPGRQRRPRAGYGGLGLGLAIVHDLVRLHGGEVEVQSAGVGLGATFVVTLRASDAPRPAESSAQTASRRPSSLAGHSIMLLEDHADSRELLVAGAAERRRGGGGVRHRRATRSRRSSASGRR